MSTLRAPKIFARCQTSRRALGVSRHVPQRQRQTAVLFATRVASQPVQVAVVSDDDFLRLKVVVPPKRVQEICGLVITELRKNYSMPGFRDISKVPEDMIVKAAGGESQVRVAYIEALLKETIEEAFEGRDDGLVDGSQKVDTDIQGLLDNFDKKEPFTYVVSAERGNMGIEYTASYKGLEITVEAVTDEASEEAQVDSSIASFLKENGGELTVAADRGLRMGDVLIADFDIVAKRTGEALEGGSGKSIKIDCSQEDSFYPGVIRKLLDIQAGEERSVAFTFPDYWEPQELAGLEMEARVKANEIFEWRLPELTIELVQQTFPEIESLQQLRERLRESVQLDAQATMLDRMQNAIAGKLLEITNFQMIPKTTFNDFALEEYSKELRQAISEGTLAQEQVEQLANEEVAEAWISNMRDSLEARFKVLMILDDIFHREQLAIDEERVQDMMQNILKEAKEAEQELDEDDMLEHLRNQGKNISALAFLQEHASVAVTPVQRQ